MVMHARKIPRLNDGYYSRGSAHPFEDKGSSKSRDSPYNDKYSRKDSTVAEKHSPRYVNKSSYKGRGDRGKSRSPSADRRSNHHSGHKDSSSNRHSNNFARNRSEPSSKDKKSEKDHRIEIQKFALRICQDWSEHLSSSGKRYYYNCKTEVSKWEKPKDWNEDKALRTDYGRDKEAQLQKQANLDRSKHSSSSTSNSHSSSSRYNHLDRNSTSNASDRDKQYKSRSDTRDYRDKNYSSSRNSSGVSSSSAQRRKESGGNVSQSALSALQNPRVLQGYKDSSSKDRATGNDSSKTTSYRDKYGRRDGRSERGGNGTPRSRQGSVTPSTVERDRDGHESALNSLYRTSSAVAADQRPTNLPVEDNVNRVQEDMDISPGSTPTEESMARGLSSMLPTSGLVAAAAPVPISSAGSNPVLGAVAALPQLISQIGDKTLRGFATSNNQNNPQGSAKLNSAIQTLQKLQEALMAQQRQQRQQQQTLANLLQQQLQQQQVTPTSSTHQPSPSSQPRTNGGVVTHAPTVSAAATLLSPVVGVVSATHPGNNGLVGTPLRGAAQVVTSSPFHAHLPPSGAPPPLVLGAASPAVIGAQQTQSSQLAHAQPLYVVTENGGQSPGAESAGTPLCSPELNLPDDNLHKTDIEKDTSQEDIRCTSPAASQSSSQKAFTGLSAAAVQLTRQDSYKLPPSLANFYKGDLITHTLGWPMEGIEKQADQIKTDSHTVGNLLSTQVSCELKKARSLVRVSEIQSTLQEQRVLFIRQQIKDLENFRNTNISFMSPKQGR